MDFVVIVIIVSVVVVVIIVVVIIIVICHHNMFDNIQQIQTVLFCTLLLLLCGKQKSTIINRVPVILDLS